MNCSFCNRKAVYKNEVQGRYYCDTHFSNYVEASFRKELRDQLGRTHDQLKIAVAISGGKDSSTLLYLLWKTLKENRKVHITAFTIDEGIEGYRNLGLESARKLCGELGIEHMVLSFNERFGKDMDTIVKSGIKLEGSPCSYCGPMRRDLMNRASTMINADYVALGINLDDYAQSIAMNFLRGDYERMIRLAPHKRKLDGMVRRIIPLRKLSEKEIKLYAILNSIEHDQSWCPFSLDAQRNKARDLLNSLEVERPGTKLAIVSFLDSLKENNKQDNLSIGKCKKCGNPANGQYCSSCIKSGFDKEEESFQS
ncbi:TIGR00269 family protein [Caldiplasma sukawensis]